MHRVTLIALIVLAGTAREQYAQHPEGNANVPLVGSWRLNLARTHYGPDVDVRRRETFTCDVTGRKLRCVIRGVREDGREIEGQFTAPMDASPAPVIGIPDADSVALSQPVPSL